MKCPFASQNHTLSASLQKEEPDSTAGSDVDASTAAVDGAVRDGDVAASSNPRGLSTEPEGERFFLPSPTRSMAELRIKLNHAIRPDEKKMFEGAAQEGQA